MKTPIAFNKSMNTATSNHEEVFISELQEWKGLSSP